MVKKVLTLIVLTAFTIHLYGQKVHNTSFINQAGEKVLRLEVTVPVSVQAAWQVFTTDSQLQKWIAPVAHIELKTGGYILTNYNKDKKLTDSSSIKLPIVIFLDNEQIVFKVNLNNNFAASARSTDQNLQEIIQFKAIDATHTRIISTMVGFGKSPDWDKTYNFFVKGNVYTYQELLKLYDK